MDDNLRPCWQNCIIPDDKSFLDDKELATIDAMEDSLVPLDDDTVRIRRLITCFESCYHEADKQAELIIKAIGSGQPPEESGERPPKRKQELQNCCDILSAWCEDSLDKVRHKDVGGIAADKLVSFIGNQTPLKVWQVRRVVDKVTFALDPSRLYHTMALDVGDSGEPGACPAGEHYKEDSTFLEQTKETIIHDTVDGRKAEISLAIAIDLLQPCNWNFVGNLAIILKVVGGDLYPKRPFAHCARNILLIPLGDRLKIISNTLGAFWQAKQPQGNIDSNILGLLGANTTVKCWLAASLDKTIRLQLDPVNVKRMAEFVEKLLK